MKIRDLSLEQLHLVRQRAAALGILSGAISIDHQLPPAERLNGCLWTDEFGVVYALGMAIDACPTLKELFLNYEDRQTALRWAIRKDPFAFMVGGDIGPTLTLQPSYRERFQQIGGILTRKEQIAIFRGAQELVLQSMLNRSGDCYSDPDHF